MRMINVVVVTLFSIATIFGQGFVLGSLIKVKDYGELYSTFKWEPAQMAMLKANLGDATANAVIQKSTEAAWPKGIASLGTRAQNRASMTDYTTFYLTALDEYRAILFVPAVENSWMAEDMKPVGDIYFVVNSHAIELKNIGTATYPPAPATFNDFAAQLDEITRDFKNGFANVINQIIGEDVGALVVYYGTQVPLDGTDELYFVEDLMAETTMFHAGFPGHLDPANGLKAYQELVRRVEALKLSCCPLSKGEEIARGNRRQQPFRAHDPKGLMEVGYQNMAIEVALDRGETFDSEGQILDFWIPVLYVYGL